ncbi:hypothetical protein COLU111180_12095 [Cohnella lubricantis]|uniref:Uncharacterized protein n=1 Tax=Cohnella lubricantis TaxID=2163172 RepID=A0A841T771_9BACL|nr:hypothetical protein [Cohnella lubricantis]MBB6675959.1 hypothetical protein [Cohnella lubricantis]MBP2117924.1 hypothetical protein [Cohnella lubricantis]
MDRFSEPPIRREKPQADELDAFKQFRDMKLEIEMEGEATEDAGGDL